MYFVLWCYCFVVLLFAVLPAKSDSDFMFYLQSYQGLTIDRSLVYVSYPHDRINTQVIYRCALAPLIFYLAII